MMYAVAAGVGLIVIIIGVVEHFVMSKRKKLVQELMLEGATLSNLPPIESLLDDTSEREAIRGNVVEIGFNGCVQRLSGKNQDSRIAEAFLIDDGGGVHTLKRIPADASGPEIAKLESQAAELARLLGVNLRN